MRINSSGNVGIGTNNPNNILQVGDGGKLRISNNISDFSMIGTKDNVNDNTTNTKIFINGNTCPYAGAAGSIHHFATGTGGHIFYIGTNERMRITNAGNVACTGSIGCVGVSASGGMRIGTNLSIQNTNPQSMLHLGNCEVLNSAPVIIFGKNNGPGFRNAFMGYSESFYFLIRDYGGTNGTNTLTQQ